MRGKCRIYYNHPKKEVMPVKRVLLLVLVFVLVAQVAVAAGPQAQGPRPGALNIMRHYFGEMRAGLNVLPQAGQPRQRIRQAKERLEDLEALAQADPAALAARLLERHDAMVARAQALIANKANLPAQIVADLKAAQARVLAHTTEQAKNAANQENAAKRLVALQARQARILAAVEKHAAQIARHLIARAEAILANAPDLHARIVAGEGLAVIRERLEQRIQARRNGQ